MTTTLELEEFTPAFTSSTGERRRTHLCTTPADLARLEAAWRLLGQQTGGPIEQFDWAATCVAAAADRSVGLTLPGRQLRVIAAVHNDRLVGVLPLECKRVHGVRRLVMLGVDELHEPMGPLAADPQALRQLAAAVAEQRHPVVLDRLVVDTAALDTLRRELGRRGAVVVRQQPSYPWIPLDGSWEEPEKHLNSGRRSDLRRSRRKAEKLGEVATEIVSPRPDELDALLDEAFAVEARSWKGLEGTALARDAARAAFYCKYAHAACRQDSLRMCFLRIGGRAVATQIAVMAGGVMTGVVQGGGFWLLKIGYDAEFSDCSPGMLLLRDSIAYAARAGCSSFEFLGQSEPWIAIWTDCERPCVSLRMYPHNVHGATALAADAAFKLSGRVAAKTRQITARVRGAAKACVMPLVKRAARRYIAGNKLGDALRVKEQLAAQGHWTTIGYWDAEGDSARAVADQYLAGLDALVQESPDCYLSIKLPALRFSSELLSEVAERAVGHVYKRARPTCRLARGPNGPSIVGHVYKRAPRRIHFDALAPETADRTREMIDELLTAVPGIDLGCTLPGRWRRSPQDARWAVERGLFVRVVKGQWADPQEPGRDPRAGYLEVIDQLAGRARRVAVATHDPDLAADALRRLRAAGTPCDLELLHGLPMRRAIKKARELGVGVRVYVPYGETYLPYALSQIRRRPRILWWLAKDAVASLLPYHRERGAGNRTSNVQH
jgi:CelD/BcsL family acetyltransferase involved in cellulose biosynthesis